MANELDLDLPDVRTVAVIWGDGDDHPKVICSANCSQFEALGLLRGAARRLERECEELMDFEGDEDEDEDWDE